MELVLVYMVKLNQGEKKIQRANTGLRGDSAFTFTEPVSVYCGHRPLARGCKFNNK